MRSLRSIGVFLIVGAVICAIIAFDFYQRSKRTAETVFETLEGIEMVSFGVPLETKVAGFLGVILLVAGIRCWWVSWTSSRSKNPSGL